MDRELKEQIDGLCEALVRAASESNGMAIERAVGEQKAFIEGHRAGLDDAAFRQFQVSHKRALLAARITRQQILSEIAKNQRRLAVLNAYREAESY